MNYQGAVCLVRFRIISSAMCGVSKIVFAIFSIWGTGVKKKQVQWRRLITQEDIDFLAVQETKLARDEKIAKSLEIPFEVRGTCIARCIYS